MTQTYHTADPKLAQQSPKLIKNHTKRAQHCCKGAPKCIKKSAGAFWHNPGRMLAQTLGQIKTDPSWIPDLWQTDTKMTQTYHTADPKLAQQSPKLIKNHTIVNPNEHDIAAQVHQNA